MLLVLSTEHVIKGPLGNSSGGCMVSKKTVRQLRQLVEIIRMMQ